MDSRLATVLDYHQQTKHHYHRFARSLGYMDWTNQPDPFRRYEGAPEFALPLAPADDSPPYDELWRADAIRPRPLSLDGLAALLEHAMALSAWKALGPNRWALRINPSSGNLHPTEAYVLAGGEWVEPGVYHYAPRIHGLERRAVLPHGVLPGGALLVGLSSIHWREAWKYGERAFRYCQHDVGHALAALSISAAALGWRTRLLDAPGDAELASLLGLDRDDGFVDEERESPELLLSIAPGEPPDRMPDGLRAADWSGRAARLSADPVGWPAIGEVRVATQKPPGEPLREPMGDLPAPIRTAWPSSGGASAWSIIRRRRSAVEMDATSRLPAAWLFRMLALVTPDRERRTAPWDALPWRPRVHLALFVHRVDGVDPGLYALVRDPARTDALRRAMRPDFAWDRAPGAPEALPLFLLARGDVRAAAEQVSCGQAIAGDGAFSLGMIAELRGSCERFGPWFYRRLYWECGAVGQVLYLEAEAAGLRATGIGCFFDDPVHEVFGLVGPEWQSLYHFTVGGPLDDARLLTQPPYAER